MQMDSRQSVARLRQLRAVLNLYRGARRRETPETRGLRLLRNWLSPQQRADFEEFYYFDVIGSVSGKRYRIHYGTTANVHEIGEDGAVKMRWCFIPTGHLVRADIMLAQKIALETSECPALAVANKFLPPPRN